ncbi:Calcipressin [Cokeromyces recurvatus]|uniref:Calcipressin n=1 Tax=Cokeromyces recurvatus TaxID=90255 RepID=UPI002220DE9C|nr:Calcipressin [Cokeromyces recurvatus]KAI7907966.1 Calcipressin [Cokeromyces recurvatus]
MAHFDKAESIATNTLLIPDIPIYFFGCDDAMLTIHDAFAEFGPLYTFVPMKGFRRLMIIFQETIHAMNAKKALDRFIMVWKENPSSFPDIITLITRNKEIEQTWIDANNQIRQFRVYYGQHYTIHVDPNSNSLQVPHFQRNLLISPPGSPFEGWEQIEEDSPNQAVLASDLIHAAEISDYELDDDTLDLEERSDTELESTLKPVPKTVAIICSKGTKQPENLPSINVQDWDEYSGSEDKSLNIKAGTTKTKIVPTAMPPMK